MAVDKKYQVFVSSTYTDLIEERKAILKALLDINCIPAGMELFPAADDDQWTYIQKIIDESDYYIVIVGARYGSVSEDGLSYTEKEYDYAVSKGIPVIGFFHGSPEDIPQKNCDLDEERRKKLEQFTAKVKTKLCKSWTNTLELVSVVITSLMHEFSSNPQIGYVRADKASNPEKLLELKEKIAELEEENKKLRFNKPEGTDGLAQGEDEFEIHYSYRVELAVAFTDSIGSMSFSWNKIISIVGPSMYDECKELFLKNVLETYIKQKSKTELSKCIIHKDDFDTIVSQLYALGITQRSDKKHTASDTSTYWSLTPYGLRYVLQLKAVKRPVQQGD